MASGLFTLKQQVQALRQGAWNGQKPKSVDYLIVAGGGSGGSAVAGGGGAGGFLTGISLVPTGQTLTVTIGGGGSAATGTKGNTGSDSVFGSIVAGGGGGGASSFSGTTPANAGSGGSGGGAATYDSSGTVYTFGQGIAGQGNSGGSTQRGTAGAGQSLTGGGGGAGTAGLNAAEKNGAGTNGGAGAASAISGTMTTYAGGGGGQVSVNTVYGGGIGGLGGGGAAGTATGNNGTAGTANTGGGGGATWGSSNPSGAGGSGIVIVSYPDTYAAASAAPNATVSTSGSGSIAFNGSAALTYPTNSVFAFGTGEFTVEFWVYITSLSTYSWLFDFYTPSGYVGLPFNINFYAPTSKFRYESNSGDRIIGTTTVLVNTWYHVAICRSGSTTRMFVNGSLDGSYTDTYNYVLPTNSQPVIGSRGNYSYNLSGYMSNVRVVKGTALYTSSFTPSTTPLTAVSGTSLLLNTVSGAFAADGSGNGFSATATGTPAWNSASPFATGLGYKNRVYTWTTSGSITF
jgi:hypothetical protein